MGPSRLRRASIATLDALVLAPLRSELTGVECVVDEKRTRGRGYYSGLCFGVHATGPAEAPVELVDGGAVPWTQKLLSDSKERLVVSGIGSERLCSLLE
jgi:hypothetical protein